VFSKFTNGKKILAYLRETDVLYLKCIVINWIGYDIFI
jgi:hypothetical protein